MSARRCVLATENRGKLEELRDLLSPIGNGIELVAQSDFGVGPAVEDAATFVENALIKARHAARATGLPAIADDSGLVVQALGGAPGIRSARFAGERADDRANLDALLRALERVPIGQRQASFHCVLVGLRAADDPAPLIASGVWEGEIAARSMGSSGFGYDPVFYDPQLSKTAAELTTEAKHAVSHRGRACRQFAAALAIARPPWP
jgi:XTP/dITP diphosphohydrolase